MNCRFEISWGSAWRWRDCWYASHQPYRCLRKPVPKSNFVSFLAHQRTTLNCITKKALLLRRPNAPMNYSWEKRYIRRSLPNKEQQSIPRKWTDINTAKLQGLRTQEWPHKRPCGNKNITANEPIPTPRVCFPGIAPKPWNEVCTFWLDLFTNTERAKQDGTFWGFDVPLRHASE